MIQSSALSAAANVRHAFLGRQGGVSDGLYASLNCGLGSNDQRERVEENRRRVLTMIGCPSGVLNTVYQVHGSAVVTTTGPWRSDPPNADSIVSDSPGVALGILTADCAPVLLADATAGVIGAAHCGWRGALAGVAQQVIDGMAALGAEKGRIVAAVGPTIAQPSYEVGADFRTRFETEDEDAAAFFAPGKAGHAQFDLPGYVVHRLTQAGVETAKWVGRDTYVEEDAFFSFRRTTHRNESDYGRQISAIALVS